LPSLELFLDHLAGVLLLKLSSVQTHSLFGLSFAWMALTPLFSILMVSQASSLHLLWSCVPDGSCFSPPSHFSIPQVGTILRLPTCTLPTSAQFLWATYVLGHAPLVFCLRNMAEHPFFSSDCPFRLLFPPGVPALESVTGVYRSSSPPTYVPIPLPVGFRV